MALAWLGGFAVAVAAAQTVGSSAGDDRGYPVEPSQTASGEAGSGASSSVFAGMDSGGTQVAADRDGSAAASAAPTRGKGDDKPAKRFASADAAQKAFIDALRAGDEGRLEAIFGSQGHEFLSSGDRVADRNERATFLRHYDRKHSLNPVSTGVVTLVVGESAWPFAVPIAKDSGGYYFDSGAATKTLIFRRVGRNERDAIAVCNGFVAAQKEYAQSGHDGLPAGLYAQKLGSDAGKQNGLYWPQQSGAARSPAGPLLAEAAEQGYAEGAGRSTPYRGYFFRVLPAQGNGAREGAKSYTDKDGRQSGGFALIAYPAEYGRSGVKSFIVNQDGIVYEKDLGEGTLQTAREMRAFDPEGWRTAL